MDFKALTSEIAVWPLGLISVAIINIFLFIAAAISTHRYNNLALGYTLVY